MCDVFVDGDWIESKDQSPTGIRLIQTGNIGEGVFKNRGERARFISEDTFKRLSCTEVFEGDCLISRLPEPVGRSCILPQAGPRMITGVDCTIARFKLEHLLPEFFAYFSQSDDYLRAVDAKSTGTTRQRISRRNLGLVPVVAPPLSEQVRIVEILNETFTRIGAARVAAAKNLQDAGALFEGHLQAVLDECNRRWSSRTVGGSCPIRSGGTPSRRNESYWTGTVPWVSAKDLKSDRISDGLLHVSDEAVKQSATKMAPVGSLLVLVRGMGLANGVPIAEVVAPVAFNQDIKAIHPPADVVPRFLLLSIRGWLLRGQRADIMSSAAHGTLKIDTDGLRQIPYPLPPLAEQRSIVSQLDSLDEQVQCLRSVYQRKLAALDELRTSLLHQALEGRLEQRAS